MQEWEIVRAMHVMDGYQTAANGAGILTNPNKHGTPEFNHFVDGWCRYWADQGKKAIA